MCTMVLDYKLRGLTLIFNSEGLVMLENDLTIVDDEGVANDRGFGSVNRRMMNVHVNWMSGGKLVLSTNQARAAQQRRRNAVIHTSHCTPVGSGASARAPVNDRVGPVTCDGTCGGLLLAIGVEHVCAVCFSGLVVEPD